MEKILVPVDFSKPSLAALDFAFEIAKKTKAELIALHVVEESSSESFSVSGQGAPSDALENIYNYKLLERARARLQRLVLDPRYNAVTVSGELRAGNPFHAISTAIEHLKPQLVTMGVKGNSQLEQMLIGSNVEKVLRCCHIPVLAVHKKPASPLEIKKILCATSLLDWEKPFYTLIATLQKIFDAKLHLLHVNTPGSFQRSTETLKLLEQFAKKMKIEHYAAHAHNDFSEEEGILNFADQIGAHMVAMPSHGRQGFAHLIAGSIAEDVMARAKRPSLVYVAKK